MPVTLNVALERLNREFCVVSRLPGIAVIPTADDPEIHIYSRGEFCQTICANRRTGGRAVAGEWMQWPLRREVKRLTYAPGRAQFEPKSDALNTWIPSPIKPVKGDIALWTAYVDHIFQSDATHKDWFLAWLAYQFQHPGVKLHSAVVFWSAETGTGKSLFGYLMSELFGAHNFAEINEAELHGNFNFWAARKQFVMGEEIKGSNAQKQADFLKSVITRRFVTINTKNTPHYTLPDCINYFFTSNRENAFFLDDTDRRFFVHKLADVKLEADYVEHTLKPWLQNSGYSAILHELLHIDLAAPLASTGKPFNPFGPAPQTSARNAMIRANREDMDCWWDEYTTNLPETPVVLALDDLWALYLKYNRHAKDRQHQFKLKLGRRLLPLYGGNQVRTDAGRRRLFLVPRPETEIQRSEYARLNSLTNEELSQLYAESRDDA
jgi:hypothetical protein